MNDPIITFIIPTIGRITLQRTINSLLAMNDPDWKAIVIFDGIDPTINNTDSRIKLIKINKTGVSNNAGSIRNIGINLAETQWVGFVDDDDTLRSNYVTNLKNHIKNNKPDVIIFRMQYINGMILPKD